MASSVSVVPLVVNCLCFYLFSGLVPTATVMSLPSKDNQGGLPQVGEHLRGQTMTPIMEDIPVGIHAVSQDSPP